MLPFLRLPAFILLALAGCEALRADEPVRLSPNDELRDFQRAIKFEAVAGPSLEGFQRHWTIGNASAWFRSSTCEVLVIDLAKPAAIKISGFPRGYGGIVATGWKDGKEFFVHLSRTPHSGTMIYINPLAKTVKRIEHWAGH